MVASVFPGLPRGTPNPQSWWLTPDLNADPAQAEQGEASIRLGSFRFGFALNIDFYAWVLLR